MRPGSLRRAGMQNDSAGAMVARTDTAFLTEDCSPTFRVSMVPLTICKHPTELHISLPSHVPQPKDEMLHPSKGAYLNADVHTKIQMCSRSKHGVADMYNGMHTHKQMNMHVHMRIFSHTGYGVSPELQSAT